MGAAGWTERADSPVQGVKPYQENFSSGKPRCTWSAGLSTGGNYLLEGKQTLFYKTGRKQWEATFRAGRKAGTETLWKPDSSKQWERLYDAGGRGTWLIYDAAGQLKAQSHWLEKDLVEVR
jgi:antitoxin component YwqK of YwqJK toxin-antitoxin module